MKKVNGRRESSESVGDGKSRQQKPFPPFSLKDTLVIAQSIADNNACRPYSRLSVAEAIDRSPESSAFRQLITASSAYGLTEGGYQAKQLALTPLGMSIVAPKNAEERASGLLKAAMNISLYRRLYEHFDQHKIPADDHFRNTLIRDFNVPAEDVLRCIKGFKEDGRFVGLIREISGAERVSVHDAQPTSVIDEGSDDNNGGDDASDKAPPQIFEKPDSRQLVTPPEQKQSPLRVFISHGGNRQIVDQVKTMLELADMPCDVVVEQESAAIPVPEKVFSAMHRCSAAVICITAEEKFKREDGSYALNENVLIEIGAAFVLYDKRVVLLWDRRLSVPSNLQGLYRCEFEGSELSWSAAMKLMKAVNEFKKVNVG